jgi:hypothetical protein
MHAVAINLDGFIVTAVAIGNRQMMRTGGQM